MLRRDYKVLFVSFYNIEAYGLRQLHSILNSEGYDAKMLFLKLNSVKNRTDLRKKIIGTFTNESNNLTKTEEELLVNFILDYKPDLICFSLLSPNFGLYKRIFNSIRSLGDFKILLGGWQVSLNPEQCIDYADILCIGEGEEILPELVRNLFDNKPITNIPNLWINTGNGIVKNPVGSLNQDLNKFPIPVFNDKQSYYIENDQFLHKEPYMDNTSYGIIAGRGCPYKCTYCSNSFMAENIYPKAWSKIRHRSVEHVISELIQAKQKLPKITRINFYDEVFLPQKDWALKFFERYCEEIKLPFYCMFFPGTCNDELAGLLSKAMLDGVWLGVQSGSVRVRKEVFKRHYTNETVIKQADIFKKNNINVRYDFILDNPFESFEESLESIKLMLEFPEPFSLNLFSLKYFPNTEITRMALEAGIIKEDNLDDHIKSDHHNYFISGSDKNSDNNFINYVAMYISLLAVDVRVQKEKQNISKIIDNYILTRKIEEIKDVLEALLHI